jgi:hypothetical protein
MDVAVKLLQFSIPMAPLLFRWFKVQTNTTAPCMGQRPLFLIEWSPNRYYISRFNSIYVSYVGTNLGRLNERSAGKWGIGGTSDAELE